jgi:hypothetical protein
VKNLAHVQLISARQEFICLLQGTPDYEYQWHDGAHAMIASVVIKLWRWPMRSTEALRTTARSGRIRKPAPKVMSTEKTQISD